MGATSEKDEGRKDVLQAALKNVDALKGNLPNTFKEYVDEVIR